MATVFDINFSVLPPGDMNASAPSGLRWSDIYGFSFSDPAISGGALVGVALNRVVLNKTLPGDDYGDVLDSWFVNGGYSAVPGHIEMQFTLSNDSFVSFGCVDTAYDSGQPLFAFTVTEPEVKKVQCKVAQSSSATTVSNADLLVGGSLNTARITWDEYSVTFTLNGTVLHTLASADRPRMHPAIRLNGTARVTRLTAGDTNPEPPAAPPVYWTNKINVTETP